MKKLAVYGTLRKGRGNWSWALNREPITTEEVSINYRMVNLGGFPGLIPSKEEHSITIETFEVNDQEYRAIERLEGYPDFYQKAKIQTSIGECEIYTLEKENAFVNSPIVKSGDWNKK